MLIERDGGLKCFYCTKELNPQIVVLEHLNNNRRDNRFDNFVLACQSCNTKKGKERGLGPLNVMASEKLERNESEIFVGEKFLREKLNLSGSLDSTEASKEIEINMKNFEITQQYITEKVDEDGFIDFKDALNSCVYLCKTQTIHGSPQSVRGYILALTSPVAPFEITRNVSKKKIIVKRMNRIDLTRNQVPTHAT